MWAEICCALFASARSGLTVWSYCGWREKPVEKMSDIVVYLVKQLIVGVFHQLIERRQVWRTKSTALAMAKKRVDALSVCCRDEAASRTGRVEYLGDNYRPKDSVYIGRRHISHDSV